MKEGSLRQTLRERREDLLLGPLVIPALALLAVARGIGLLALLCNRLVAAAGRLLDRLPAYRRYEQYINYMIFGTATSVIQFAGYYLCLYLLGCHYVLADNLGFAAAVIFAYHTNKKYVYKATAAGRWERVYQFIMFVGSRLAGQLIETVLLIVFVEWLGANEAVAKFPVLVLVITVNYLSGRLLVFTKRRIDRNK